MTKEPNNLQEPKYRFEDGRVVNRASGEAIPLDEPVMVFRARDRRAEAAIRYYASLCADEQHVAIVEGRAEQFRVFSEIHPSRMKEPDTEPLL